MNVLILSDYNGGWEGLFIDGNLIDEGHIPLGEGDSNTYLLEMAEKYGFRASEVYKREVESPDSKYLRQYGCFPKRLEELKNDYIN